MLRLLFSAPHHHSTFMHAGFASHAALWLGRALPSARSSFPTASLHHSNAIFWYRNFYLLSIAYAFRLGLGPDLPRADEPTSGNLSRSVDGILTRLSLLTPAFSLLSAPHVLPVMLRRT